jgi:hypothetical protein
MGGRVQKLNVADVDDPREDSSAVLARRVASRFV